MNSSSHPLLALPLAADTAVQYERLPQILRTKHIWSQIAISIILNWIIGPFVRLSGALPSTTNRSMTSPPLPPY